MTPDDALKNVLSLQLWKKRGRSYTLVAMAKHFDLGERGRETVGDWEKGNTKCLETRRTQWITWLRDHLGQTEAQGKEIWRSFELDWGWSPLTEGEWQTAIHKDFPTRLANAAIKVTGTEAQNIDVAEISAPSVMLRLEGFEQEQRYRNDINDTVGGTTYYGNKRNPSPIMRTAFYYPRILGFFIITSIVVVIRSWFFVPIDMVEVPAIGDVEQSRQSLQIGAWYVLRASGTANAGIYDIDAEYSFQERTTKPTYIENNCYNSEENTDLGIGINETQMDNRKHYFWGEYNKNHVYTLLLKGEDAHIELNYHDCEPENNSGSINVEIFRAFPFTSFQQFLLHYM
ncbi:MAG: hypothetical protein IPP13_21945 [Kouleothrix sp.]|jgi:hypothetical protein|nr:hypothetical protein [Kouleothrix sp.]